MTNLRERVAEAIFNGPLQIEGKLEGQNDTSYREEYWINPARLAIDCANAAIEAVFDALLSDAAVEAGAEGAWNRESGEWDTTPDRPWAGGVTVDHPSMADYYRHMARAALKAAHASLTVATGAEEGVRDD